MLLLLIMPMHIPVTSAVSISFFTMLSIVDAVSVLPPGCTAAGFCALRVKQAVVISSSSSTHRFLFMVVRL
jgi:hypothetical protein